MNNLSAAISAKEIKKKNSVNWADPLQDTGNLKVKLIDLNKSIYGEAQLRKASDDKDTVDELEEFVKALANTKFFNWILKQKKAKVREVSWKRIKQAMVFHGNEETITRILATGSFQKAELEEMISYAMEYSGCWSKIPYFLAYLNLSEE